MTVQDARCSHCQLPLGNDPVHDGDRSFCCAGCHAVATFIGAQGLDAYYTERSGAGRPALLPRSDFEPFDDPGFLSAHCKRVKDGTLETELYLEGVHCSACVWLVEKLPVVLPGVEQARLHFSEGLLDLRFRPDEVALSKVAETLSRLGYEPRGAGEDSARKAQRTQERKLLARMGVAGAAFGNAMLLAFALYSGEAADMNGSEANFFRWLSLLVSVPAVLYAGAPFFQGAIAALRARAPHMDVPISLGIGVATLWSAICTVRGQGEVYFDSVTMLVFFLLGGRFLQARELSRARQATDLMLSLAPSTARLLTDTGVTVVPTDSLSKGACIEIQSGARIGVDGIVESGESTVDRSLLSGESKPVRVRPGDTVHAGTVNLHARLVVRVTGAGRETRLGALVSDVARAAREKAPYVEMANRLSAYLLLAVLSLATVAALLGARHGVDEAVERAVALLIVTCPCALGLATPLSASVALAQAARRGILVKGARFLELLSRPALFVFDKTGTLTSGRVRVVAYHGDREALALAAAAEADSAHPVAVALRERAGATPRATEASEVLGGGVRAEVHGRAVLVGSQRFVEAEVGADDQFAARARSLSERGLSPVFIAVDGAVRAVAGLGDPLRPDARECLRELQQRGHRLAICSGDDIRVVESVRRDLGVEFAAVLGEQSPEQKLAFVRSARAHGRVVMVGDGVNDAAALTLADVGIAVAGGAEASLSAADVFATRRGLRPIVELVQGATRTVRLVRLNLAFSLSYNAVAAALALAGLVHPLVAAVLMPLSSLTVVANTLRYRCFKKQDDEPDSLRPVVAQEVT